MGYVIGLVLALAVWGFGRWSGFDRDRAFYATMVVVVASYYVLFAAMGGSAATLVVESAVMGTFALAAVLGFKRYPWLVVAGLAGHGVFDAVHDLAIANPGVPEWWPSFCGTFDVAAAALLAYSLAGVHPIDGFCVLSLVPRIFGSTEAIMRSSLLGLVLVATASSALSRGRRKPGRERTSRSTATGSRTSERSPRPTARS